MDSKAIVVIDDDENMVKAIKRILTYCRRDTQVHTLTDPGSAVSFIRKIQPDLLILDIMMPGTDGTTLASMLREVPELRKLPIIFLTGIISHEEQYCQLGATECYLGKPIDKDVLLKKVSEYLDVD